MNAERLHAIALALREEMRSWTVTAKMQSMVEALRAVVQSSNASTQQNLASSLTALYATITDTASDKFSPAWRQILSEIGGEDLFGWRLKERIETILAQNQITPAVALQELEQILKTLAEFEKSLNSATTAFQRFQIGDEKLKPGEVEIGVLIPRQAVKNLLVDFADELKVWDFILNAFSEVATGKPDELEIKSISSSNFMVYLQGHPTYAACLAVAIERIVAIYKQLLEIRKLHREIRKQGVPAEKVTGIEQYANELMKDGIEQASVEIVNEFYKTGDKGRKNELTTKVRISMNRIANRIDQGFNVEVRVAPLEDGESKEQNGEVRKSIALIQSAASNMQFMKLEGQPLLKLPESAERNEEKGVEKPRRKTDKAGSESP